MRLVSTYLENKNAGSQIAQTVVEPVVFDYASGDGSSLNELWELLAQEDVVGVFGCWHVECFDALQQRVAGFHKMVREDENKIEIRR